MKHYTHDNDLTVGAILGFVAGAALTIGAIALTQSLTRRRTVSLLSAPYDRADDGPSLMEDLVSHNMNGF